LHRATLNKSLAAPAAGSNAPPIVGDVASFDLAMQVRRIGGLGSSAVMLRRGWAQWTA
jgi:hypothetical protein